MVVKLKSILTSLRFWFAISTILIAIGLSVDRHIINIVSSMTTHTLVSPQLPHLEYSIGEVIELSDGKLTVNTVHVSKGLQLNKPNGGMNYVVVHVTIENVSNKPISYSPQDFRMISIQAKSTDVSAAILDKDTTLINGILAPNEQITETITFKQSLKNEKLQLLYQPSFESNRSIKVNL
jgi:Domain of unknown function (DUF4352)